MLPIPPMPSQLVTQLNLTSLDTLMNHTVSLREAFDRQTGVTCKENRMLARM